MRCDHSRTLFASVLLSSITFGQPQPDHSHDSPYYTLQAESVPAEDTALITESLDDGIASLLVYFDGLDLDPLLRSLDIKVTIHAEPNQQANTSTATIRTGTRDGNRESFFAEIHILAPSAHPEGLTTSSGEPKDDLYFRRLVVHEYSTILIDLASRGKEQGWRYRSAPAWFVQGYQEYLGLTCAGQNVRERSLAAYVGVVKADPGRVADDFGLEVVDPYITGAVLLHFMHETYGGDRVLALLLSPERTFGRAVRNELAIDLATFMRDWEAWIAAQ